MPKMRSKKHSRRSSKSRAAAPVATTGESLKNKILSVIFLSKGEGLDVEEIAGMLQIDTEDEGVPETLELVLNEMSLEGLVGRTGEAYILEEKGFERIERFPE